MLTNKRMLLQDSCGSLLNSELMCATMSADCKSWSNGSEPESSNKEEEYSNDCVVRSLGSTGRVFIGLPYRQLISLKKLVVFPHSFYKTRNMVKRDGCVFGRRDG